MSDYDLVYSALTACAPAGSPAFAALDRVVSDAENLSRPPSLEELIEAFLHIGQLREIAKAREASL